MKFIENCRIIDRKWLTKDTYEIVFETKDIAKASKAGQFVEVKLDQCFLRRPISIGKINGDNLHLYVKVVGRGTKNLSTIALGEEINIIGPLGNTFSKPQKKKIAVVGGGIGIAPLVEYIRNIESENEIYAFLGYKDEVFLTDYFHDVADEVYVSVENNTRGDAKYITELLEKAIEDHIEIDQIVTCGPRGMMKAVIQLADKHGIKTEASLEERMGCGFGVCVGCSIELRTGEMKKVCVDGPIFDAREVNCDEW